MAYTLLGTGIATNLVMCLAVDSDGATIKEFVSTGVNGAKTFGTASTPVTPTFGSSTWKGVSRGYFGTTDATFDYNGVRFASGNRPAVVSNAAFSFFAAVASFSTGTGLPAIVEWFSSGTPLVDRGGSQGGPLRQTVTNASASTSAPNSTKLSLGFSYDDVTAGAAYYYGLESGSLAADGTSATHNFGAATINIFGVGGATGQGSQPGNWHLVALFNRVLTLTEMQSLHTDWFGTLFVAPGGSGAFGRPYYNRLIGGNSNV